MTEQSDVLSKERKLITNITVPLVAKTTPNDIMDQGSWHGCPFAKDKIQDIWYSTKAFPLRRICPFAVFGW